jgi:hypothetical protein
VAATQLNWSARPAIQKRFRIRGKLLGQMKNKILMHFSFDLVSTLNDRNNMKEILWMLVEIYFYKKRGGF